MSNPDFIEPSKGAPSFVNYILGISSAFMIISSLSMLFESLSAGTDTASDLTVGAGVLGVGTLITFVEFYFLRKNMNPIGGFGIGVAGEAIKLVSTVSMVKGFDTTILTGLYIGSIASLFVSKFLRERIDHLATTGISRNILNVLPTVIILFLFTGGSLLTNLGFGAISHAHNPEACDSNPDLPICDEIDFSLFNVPEWNAAYFLDNILDQFTAGLQFPEEIIFNVTNLLPDPFETEDQTGTPQQKPITYFRDRTFDEYAYDPLKAKSGTWFESQTETNRYLIDNLFSSHVPIEFESELSTEPSQRQHSVANFRIRKFINHSTTFQEKIPTVWNGRYGAFVEPFDNNTANLQGLRIDGQSCSQLGLSVCSFIENSLQFDNFGDVANVQLDLQGFKDSSDETLLEYDMRYLQPNIAELMAFSLGRSQYNGSNGVFDDNTWNAINSFYLQKPSGNTLPSTGLVRDANDNINEVSLSSYESWAPKLKELVDKYNDEGATVFNQALAITQAIAPGGEDGKDFDAQLWVREQAQTLTEGTHYPFAGEEYINWFLNRDEGGISLHFASTLTMALRLMGIPARTVTGWAAGNNSIDTSKEWRVITAYFTHAWTEVLLPLQYPFNPYTGLPTATPYLTYEWVTFDPLITSLLGATLGGGITNTETRPVVLDPFAYNQSIPITDTNSGFSNLAGAIHRVGVDQNNDSLYDPINDDGIVGTDFVNPTILNIGAFTASINYIGGTPTSIIGVPNVDITFSVFRVDQNVTIENMVPVRWNTDNENITVKSGLTNYTATVEFRYDMPMHGTGLYLFAATFENSTYASAFSDRDRIGDGDTVNNQTFEFNINYSPHLFQIGTPLMMFNKISKPIQKISDLNNQDNQSKLQYNQIISQNHFIDNIENKHDKIPEILQQNDLRSKNMIIYTEKSKFIRCNSDK